MSKATEFSPKEVVLVAVNSIITKLFLLFPSTLTTVGKSSSIILCLLTAAAGVIILYAIAALYGKQLVRSFLANDPSGNMNSLQQESSLNINAWQASYPYLTQR